jgi:hypothetical protein
MTDIPEGDDVERVSFLRAPSACGTEFDQVDWAGTLTVRFQDDKHAGLRFNDKRLMEAVALQLEDRVRDFDPPAPPYYSIKLNAPTRRSKTPMHYVYLGPRPVVGTRDVARLLDGLATHLGQHFDKARTDAYMCSAVPVLTPAGILLVPGDLNLMSKVVDRVLRPAGYEIAEVPFVYLDPAAGEVEIPQPPLGLRLDDDTRAALPASAAEARLGPGRYKIDRWLMPVSADDAGPLRHAKAVLYGTRSIRAPFPRGAQAAVDDVARLTDDVPVTGVAWSSDEGLVQAVLQAGRG